MLDSLSRPAALTALALALVLSGPLAAAQYEPEEAREDEPPIGQLLQELRAAAPARRGRAAERLIVTGARGLSATRAARESETDPALRLELDRIAVYQLAEKITPTLVRELETNLRYDGQFSELAAEGPEVRRALLAMLDDEATPFALRVESSQALADVGKREDLPRLRELWSDPLLARPLRDRIGLLMAILGDKHVVDRELERLRLFLVDVEWDESAFIPANARLAELYYQIRAYEQAIETYERILMAYSERYKVLIERTDLSADDKESLRREFALYHYNAACSNTLGGKFPRAQELLRKAIELDPSHYANIEKDGDFRKLRELPDYADFRAELGGVLPQQEL